MGLIKKILWFIGGKPPEIIFENGEVRHDHTPKKWQDWKDRFEKGPNYDWRIHRGTNWDKNQKPADRQALIDRQTDKKS